MQMLPLLRRIVFEKQKYPYYCRREHETTTALILDKEGLQTFVFTKDELTIKLSQTWNELREEDVTVFFEKIGVDKIEKLLGGK